MLSQIISQAPRPCRNIPDRIRHEISQEWATVSSFLRHSLKRRAPSLVARCMLTPRNLSRRSPLLRAPMGLLFDPHLKGLVNKLLLPGLGALRPRGEGALRDPVGRCKNIFGYLKSLLRTANIPPWIPGLPQTLQAPGGKGNPAKGFSVAQTKGAPRTRFEKFSLMLRPMSSLLNTRLPFNTRFNSTWLSHTSLT